MLIWREHLGEILWQGFGRSLQADGEAVDAGPPSLRLLAIVDPVFCEFHGDGGDDGTVEAARDERDSPIFNVGLPILVVAT